LTSKYLPVRFRPEQLLALNQRGFSYKLYGTAFVLMDSRPGCPQDPVLLLNDSMPFPKKIVKPGAPAKEKDSSEKALKKQAEPRAAKPQKDSMPKERPGYIKTRKHDFL
jgi:hypothetical protein